MTVFDEPSLLEVTAEEAQVLRIFSVAPASPEEAALGKAAAEGGMALADAAAKYLGVPALDSAWLELVNRKDVETMGGMEAYLKAGYDPPEAALDLLRPGLDAAPRHLLLVLSRAFLSRPATLAPSSGLTGLAAASLLRDPPTATPMPADEAAPGPVAAPESEKPPMSKGRVSGMVALAALLVAGALVLLMVLIAG